MCILTDLPDNKVKLLYLFLLVVSKTLDGSNSSGIQLKTESCAL